MKIGYVSSYNTRCGVAEYCKNLVDGVRSRGIEVKVAANFLKEVLEPDPEYVKRFFHTPFLTGKISANWIEMFEYLKDCNIIHVMLQTALYHPDWFSDFIYHFSSLQNPPKIVFTMHDSGLWHSFSPGMVDHFITHEDMWCSNSTIPMGVRFYDNIEQEPDYNQICSFGLGRNDDSMVKQAIEGTPLTYKTNYGHHQWLSVLELVRTIKKSWIVSLLYPKIEANVSSSAVMMAMSTLRPILVSNSNWFSTVINYPNIYVCDGLESLKEHISYLTDVNNRKKINEDIVKMREKIIEDGRSYSSYIDKHITVYQTLLKNS